MLLYLMRHGDASAAPRGGSDGDRPLTGKGRAESRAVAAMLTERGAKVGAIYTSPLVRAVQTGEMLAQALQFQGIVGVMMQLASGCAASEFFEAIPRDAPEVVVVGHLPSIQTFAEWMVGRAVPAFGKSSVFAVDVSQGRPGRFLWMVTPGVPPVSALP